MAKRKMPHGKAAHMLCQPLNRASPPRNHGYHALHPSRCDSCRRGCDRRSVFGLVQAADFLADVPHRGGVPLVHRECDLQGLRGDGCRR